VVSRVEPEKVSVKAAPVGDDGGAAVVGVGGAVVGDVVVTAGLVVTGG
jgi:hypothetical protein